MGGWRRKGGSKKGNHSVGQFVLSTFLQLYLERSFFFCSSSSPPQAGEGVWCHFFSGFKSVDGIPCWQQDTRFFLGVCRKSGGMDGMMVPEYFEAQPMDGSL